MQEQRGSDDELHEVLHKLFTVPNRTPGSDQSTPSVQVLSCVRGHGAPGVDPGVVSPPRVDTAM